MTVVRVKTFVTVACLVAVAGSSVAGQDVVTLRDHGPNENRIDVVVLGDGYTGDELAQYSTDVNRVVAGFFREEPFATYEAYFNVHRVDVVSRESGADRDTALGSRYNCEDLPRLICVDNFVVERILRIFPFDVEMVVVLVNDSRYGGLGGATGRGIPLAVAAMNRNTVEMVLHETGHSFGHMADEYYEDGDCYTSEEPWQVNASLHSSADLLKWSHWVEPGTTVPSTSTEAGRVSAYEGAMRYPCGLYRPTYKSKMRELGNPFDPVNTEQLIKRIYNTVSPVDMVHPDFAVVHSDRCESVNFVVHVPRTGLETTWRLDGREAATGDSFAVVSCRLPEGPHEVEVEVRDDTPAVRDDPDQALRDVRSWNLVVSRSNCSCDD